MTISKEQSNIIYNIKALCILSAICAHTSGVVNGETLAIPMGCLLGSLGSIGVPIFFLCSGMLFTQKQENVASFLKKKVQGLVVPWIFVGSLVWFYVVLRKGGASVWTWLNFILGNGSYLYYMSMLLVCYLVFLGAFRNYKVVFLGAISGAWLLFESFGVVHTPNPYINPLNWLIYFAVGVLITQYNCFDKLLRGAKKIGAVASVVWILFLSVTTYLNITIDYWHKAYLLFEGLSFVTVLYCATGLKNILWIAEIGRQSFAIYLLHMPVAGLVNFLFVRWNVENALVFKPIIVLVIVMICVIILRKINVKVANWFGIR